MKNKHLRQSGLLFFMVLLSVLLLRPTETKAGIFDASSEVTYKEYWVPHSEFTAGCGDKEKPGGSWYIEPYPDCTKTLEFQLPDDFSQALKAEIYLDLWRNKDVRRAKFSINNGEVHWPDVGSDYSRTPYISDIGFTDLRLGTNSITFQTGGYHVHDIAIRIYYDDTHPLIAGSGSDVTPPDGDLLTIQGDGAAIAAGSGGKLQVDNNQLTLTADVSGDAKYVEFHSYYFGYDEDADGQMQDWHNRGRNNWYPGGQAAKPTGGTIDHPGTQATPSDGQYSVTWDIPHVPDQSGVKFKIRVVDAAGNVREAAGGVSNSFELARAKSLIAYYAPGFDDLGLWLESVLPPAGSRDFYMPSDFNAAEYESALLVHSFWHEAVINLNTSSIDIWPKFVDGDYWQLSYRNISPNLLWPRRNTVNYRYHTPELGRPGAFAEKPGPMFILQRAAWAVDNTGPSLFGQVPAPSEVGVSAGTYIQAQLVDDQSGLDYSTIKMKVQGESVSPSVYGAKHSALLMYRPSTSFAELEEVEVYIEACDLDGNCSGETYSFTIVGEIPETGIVSDDFNSCSLDQTVWEFRDPVGDTSYNFNGTTIEFVLPEGSNHDLWVDANDAPRIIQPVTITKDVDFSISAKFNSVVDTRSQSQGLILSVDAQNFLRIGVDHNGTDAFLKIYSFKNGVASTILSRTLDESLRYTVPTTLTIDRTGIDWRLLYLDENEELVVVSRFILTDYNITEVGLFAANKGVPESQAPALTSSVDFFFDTNSPIDPQDQDPLFLPVEVVGEGTVQKAPLCGNPVTLTANAANGYFFDGWSSTSGNITGRTNPLNTSYAYGETVTATFRVDELSLNVQVVNQGAGVGGSVSVAPEKAIYNFGDQVVLTPVVPTGWEFEGWSGDVDPGDKNKSPLIVTMDDDLDITATFAAEPVTLQTDVDGMGSVDVDPDQGGNYHYGDVVTIKAVPSAGWIFDHWEKNGAMSPEDNPGDFTLNGDTQVTAVFEEYSPLVYLPVIIRSK